MADFQTPSDWLTKAANTRQAAGTLNSAGARHTMLMIAAGYEKMAQHAALLSDMNLPIDSGDN